MRGNQRSAGADAGASGSIPACAGEPWTTARTTASRRVYPRVCGGTAAAPTGPDQNEGLSPRVRGNPVRSGRDLELPRSIPACAGEPSWCRKITTRRKVYPRVCGGTCVQPGMTSSSSGLSPRVRGNQGQRLDAPADRGSIPACAGEPGIPMPPATRKQVYPRVCGGTPTIAPSRCGSSGLSPRVRGNRLPGGNPCPWAGSIPACAGEPVPARHSRDPDTVYPRVCGGTAESCPVPRARKGLSPRVRGNQVEWTPAGYECRSIPACAGEPGTSPGMCITTRVYPRVCGGTPYRAVDLAGGVGLSPRVRGNRRGDLVGAQGLGSIPACAGEPAPARRKAASKPVYPRVCGGTSFEPADFCEPCGLSPRVRGNRRRYRLEHPDRRSIPACAGEPIATRAGIIIRSVYPRVCGGTCTDVYLFAVQG